MFRVPSNRATSGWRAALFVALNCAVILHASAARAPHDALGLEFKTGLNATTSSRMPHLRVLVLGEHANQAHRRDALEFAILADYAKQHHVILDWLPVFRPKELYERLPTHHPALSINWARGCQSARSTRFIGDALGDSTFLSLVVLF
jgi:hypothetical protein